MNEVQEEQQRTKWRDNPVTWGSFLIAVMVTVGSLGASWVGYERRLSTIEETVRIFISEAEKDGKAEARFRTEINLKLDNIQAQLASAHVNDAVNKARLEVMQQEVDRMRNRTFLR